MLWKQKRPAMGDHRHEKQKFEGSLSFVRNFENDGLLENLRIG